MGPSTGFFSLQKKTLFLKVPSKLLTRKQLVHSVQSLRHAIFLLNIPCMSLQADLCQGFTYGFPQPHFLRQGWLKGKCCGRGSCCIVNKWQNQNHLQSFKIKFLVSMLVPLNLSPKPCWHLTLVFRNCLSTEEAANFLFWLKLLTFILFFIFYLFSYFCLFSILSLRKLIL